MSIQFFEKPILNSPYLCPTKHWELDKDGQPTQKIADRRRRADFVTPIPKPKKYKNKKGEGEQQSLIADGTGLSTQEQEYQKSAQVINNLRDLVDEWRKIPNSNDWRVTPETARLLQHWRRQKTEWSNLCPFFCQVEAVETAIWLTEVAPKIGKVGKAILQHLDAGNDGANPELSRLALKLATGAGKTTVMAMLIAWQTVNAVRRPQSKKYTRGFLIVAPGITIRDRLRVLQPNDPDSYYESRELVPRDMMPDLGRVKIVITNYHAFKLRERVPLSKGGRSLLQGRGDALNTLESEGQMLQRVMPGLMGLKNIMAINDEAHHCYREKPEKDDEGDLKGDDRKEAKENSEAARLWINGLEAVNRKIGIARVMDLSATPFFLRGSGYAEGTLFPWTMSDFSLMDAIECGIVKLPRVPISDNITDEEMPVFRKLWDHIGKRMPKKKRGESGDLDPLSLPVELQTALEALYGHYEETFNLWEDEGTDAPPCFIVVCQNTSISELVYKYISGFIRENTDGSSQLENGRLELFQNYNEHGNPLPKPRTFLIDSQQLESGEAIDDKFRKMFAPEIERFRREKRERTKDAQAGENISDEELLREVMNTVGKPDRLGGGIRCVVSVSMLTEGWDANTVTHVLGVRAFGTQLLCEQVIGRALRRQSYDLNEEGLFDVEYADILGIPFDFTAKPVPAKAQKPRQTVQVRAVSPDRDQLELQFPRVTGYRTELPEEYLSADFNDDSTLVLSPKLVGPSITKVAGIVGQDVNLNLKHTEDVRRSTILYNLTYHLLYTKFRDPGGDPELHLFGKLKRITKKWLDNHLVCQGGTFPAQLMYKALADMACERIQAAITRSYLDTKCIKVLLDPYNPTGSTMQVNFTTSAKHRWKTHSQKCHINWAILHSDWEEKFCMLVEDHPKVLSYVKNHNMGFEVPYRYQSESKRYIPDFIVQVDDGHGEEDPLHVIVEIKGYRGEDAKDKKNAMEVYWVPGVNNHGGYGRWTFVELTEPYSMAGDFEAQVNQAFKQMIETAVSAARTEDE